MDWNSSIAISDVKIIMTKAQDGNKHEDALTKVDTTEWKGVGKYGPTSFDLMCIWV